MAPPRKAGGERFWLLFCATIGFDRSSFDTAWAVRPARKFPVFERSTAAQDPLGSPHFFPKDLYS